MNDNQNKIANLSQSAQSTVNKTNQGMSFEKRNFYKWTPFEFESQTDRLDLSSLFFIHDCYENIRCDKSIINFISHIIGGCLYDNHHQHLHKKIIWTANHYQNEIISYLIFLKLHFLCSALLPYLNFFQAIFS